MATHHSKSYQFRKDREGGWQRLEALVLAAEKSGIRSLSAKDAFEMPHLYRSALSGLSVARAISLDRNLVDYLENLTTRAYLLFYGHQRPAGQAFIHLMRYSVPNAVRAIRLELTVSTAVFLAGVLVAFFLVLGSPDWFFTFVSPEMANGRQPGATAEQLANVLYQRDGTADGLDIFATFLFTHNARVGLLAFALGFALGVPTLWLLFSNGATLGAMFALYHDKSLGMELGGWLIIHGTTEILAILLCGAAGLAIARHYVFPGRLSRMEALAHHGKQAALVAFGCITMFLVAGLLEGFGRQLITSDLARYIIGLAFLAMWGLYFASRWPAPDEDGTEGAR
ncbi:stage II sporulation protein M [Kordiimonas aestuarii]|uniref:stage II sporulation protein M n=1 Tax=Kordiimonas aestuarii TaxID=1005925 RepID=UPI0021D03776|nr:stage II sporulation protein M [Kordiimonas aestuarii]